MEGFMKSEHGPVRQINIGGREADEIVLDNLKRIRAHYLEDGLQNEVKVIDEQIHIVGNRLVENKY